MCLLFVLPFSRAFKFESFAASVVMMIIVVMMSRLVGALFDAVLLW